MLTTFGILSIATPILAFVLSLVAFLFPWVSLFGWMLVIVGIATGILAWLMASADLKRIRAGEIAPAAQRGTKLGYICGIIGASLSALSLMCNCLAVIFALGSWAGTTSNVSTSGKERTSKSTSFGPGGLDP